MGNIIESVLPNELRIKAISRRLSTRTYVVVEPNYRLDHESEPRVLLGRLGKDEKIDYSFLISQDDVLKAFLFREEIRGLKLVPQDPERGSKRIFNKLIGHMRSSMGRVKKRFYGK